MRTSRRRKHFGVANAADGQPASLADGGGGSRQAARVASVTREAGRRKPALLAGCDGGGQRVVVVASVTRKAGRRKSSRSEDWRQVCAFGAIEVLRHHACRGRVAERRRTVWQSKPAVLLSRLGGRGGPRADAARVLDRCDAGSTGSSSRFGAAEAPGGTCHTTGGATANRYSGDCASGRGVARAAVAVRRPAWSSTARCRELRLP